MSNAQPEADQRIKRGWLKTIIRIKEIATMAEKHVPLLARLHGSNGFRQRLTFYNGHSKAYSGLTHRICNERNRASTRLTHLFGHERNTPLWTAQQIT